MDTRKIIKTADLRLTDIPDDSAGWYDISIFALTFDPMVELGTTDIYKSEMIEYDGESTLQELRRSVFLWQRALNWRSGDIVEKDLQVFMSLFALMRKKLAVQADRD